jgi:prepilin-type processing-associated H-X9-DG protein
VYRIIGADDKEYGPVSAEQIRQWLREGRLNRTTRVKPENSPDWKAIGALPEFGDLFPLLPGTEPRPAGPTKTCGMATASLVCGALGFTCVTAVIGLVLGFLAHSRIRQSGGRLTGSGMATTGIVLSSIFMLLGLLAIPAAMLLPALSKAKQRAQSINCMNNIRQLELAVLLYSGDHKDVLPSATTWCDDITQYVGSPQTFHCPTGDVSQRGHYAFNAKLSSLPNKKTTNPATTVMIFETDQGWNASGGPELMPKAPRHGRAFVVGFADGHVEVVAETRLSHLKWEP